MKTSSKLDLNKLSKNDKILLEIYTEVYKEIGVDFINLLNTGETLKEDWYLNYYLDSKKQEEILNNVLKKHKLPKYTKKQLSISYWLGSSPTPVKPNKNEQS